MITGLLPVSAGCSSSSVSIGIDGLPGTLDPQLEAGRAGSSVFGCLFSGLLQCGENGELVPDCASGYTFSENGLTLTFRLREGLTWTNGEKVTSEDFAFALKRLLDPATASPYASVMSCIRGAEEFSSGAAPDVSGIACPDDGTLVLSLARRSERFIYAFASVYTLPCNEKFFLSTEGEYGITSGRTLFNGRYYVTSRGSSKVVLKRRGGADKSLPREVTFCNNADLGAGKLEKQLNRGLLDMAVTSVSLAPDVKAQVRNIYSTTYSVCFGAQKGIISEKDFFTALASGGMAQLQNENGAVRVLPQSSALLYGVSSEFTHRPGEPPAKELLAALLKSSGAASLPSVTLLVADDTDARALSDSLVTLWQKNIGVFVKREYCGAGTLARRMRANNYEIALCPVAFSAASPDGFYSDLILSLGESKELHEEYLRRTDGASGFSGVIESAEQLLYDSGRICPVGMGSLKIYTAENAAHVYYEPVFGLAEIR